MAQKISENTQVQLDLKTIGIIVAGAVALATMYFTTIMDIDDKVKDNSDKLDKIDDKLFTITEKLIK